MLSFFVCPHFFFIFTAFFTSNKILYLIVKFFPGNLSHSFRSKKWRFIYFSFLSFFISLNRVRARILLEGESLSWNVVRKFVSFPSKALVDVITDCRNELHQIWPNIRPLMSFLRLRIFEVFYLGLGKNCSNEEFICILLFLINYTRKILKTVYIIII